MVFSYLKIVNNIKPSAIQVYEDDSGVEIPEMEDRVHTLREEGLNHATCLKEIYSLFKRGLQQN